MPATELDRPTPTTATDDGRDRFIDAVRAGALLVVVLGHWLATLPRVVDGTTVANEHLLHTWDAAGPMTWLLQVVPVFVLVSAAVSSTSTSLRDEPLRWWATRAQRLARPTVTYLAALSLLWVAIEFLDPAADIIMLFGGSLTVHLWFVAMLLLVQALLPLAVAADRRWGLGAVVGLVALVIAVDMARAGFDLGPGVGTAVATAAPGIGWLNVAVVWLVPQQLGLAWRAGRLRGRVLGTGLVLAGLAWLWGATSLGYPASMVGSDPVTGASNVLPPTAALLGVVWIQAGLVLLLEHPVRSWLAGRRVWSVVRVIAALGMPLYLWHKLAELPALWIANRLGLVVDAGVPGDPGFWTGRLVWLGMCALVVAPVVAAVVAFERTRRASVPLHDDGRRLVGGGLLVVVATAVALQYGLVAALPAALAMLLGSHVLRPGRVTAGVSR